jgi:hypothetical protein
MATVDLNNQKLQEYEQEKNNLINQAQTNYNQTSKGAEQKYNELINATKDYGETQGDIVQQQTNQTIAEINQNKDKAEKDYIKEQKAGYTDYAKQTNAYGTNAEVQASAGLTGSGYSESSKISAYNTYQNRYMTARESYNQAVLNYNNQIAQAQIQNSALLAEIAFNSLQSQLQLSLEGFQYQNDLLNNLLSQKMNISSTYNSLWQSQYNTLLNEAQFNEQMAYQRQRDAIADSQWQQQFNASRAKSSGGGGSGGGSKTKLTEGNSNKGTTLGEALASGDSTLSDRIRAMIPEMNTDNKGGIIKYNNAIDRATKEVQDAYGKGQISEKEMINLVDKYNLHLKAK